MLDMVGLYGNKMYNLQNMNKFEQIAFLISNLSFLNIIKNNG